MCVRLPFSIKKRVLGGIVSSLSGLVYNSSVLPLAFFEKNKKCHISHCLTPCVFWKKKKTILYCHCLSHWWSHCCHVQDIYVCIYIYIYIYLSQPHTSFLLCCLLLNYSHFSSLDFYSHLSDSELSHSSVINHLHFSSKL